MSYCHRKESEIEKELRFWEGASQKITVISFSFDAYKQQKTIVEANRSALLRNLDALKQTENDTDTWDSLYSQSLLALEEFKKNVKILCK